MKRRYFLGLLGCFGLGGVSVYAYERIKVSKYWQYRPDQFFNPCLTPQLSANLAHHDVVLSAWEGIDKRQMWDGHVHLLGLGDTESGIWLHPSHHNLFHPKSYMQFRFFLNASCVSPDLPVDESYVTRLKHLHLGPGSRLILLAFDYSYNEQGEPLPEKTSFYVPNEYAAHVHQQSPEIFEWIASIHPYRPDCVEALEKAFVDGARGIKWLPPAMGINPASPLCDRFYAALAYWDIPLLCHGGHEYAIEGTNHPSYGNPLALRRALDHGVKVIVAHCALQGNNRDIDKGPNGPMVSNFELFTRLMDESRYEGLLFGDISAFPLIAHHESDINTIITRQDWHSRLLYGSDYPIPGIIPLIALKFLEEKQYITSEQAKVLTQLRYHNQLLFDFVLKRHLQVQGQRFSPAVFHTRSLWTGARGLSEKWPAV